MLATHADASIRHVTNGRIVVFGAVFVIHRNSSCLLYGLHIPATIYQNGASISSGYACFVLPYSTTERSVVLVRVH